MDDQTILAAFEKAGRGCLDMDDLVRTRETLDDFKAAAKRWAIVYLTNQSP